MNARLPALADATRMSGLRFPPHSFPAGLIHPEDRIPPAGGTQTGGRRTIRPSACRMMPEKAFFALV